MMEQLVNFIIRPPRADYCPKNDLLEERFILKGRWFHRKDLKVKNGRGLLLHCSHYVPGHFPDGNTLPCVIYCHGNSGCRADASEAAIILLPSNITVFTLDFSGSGCSEGEHVTLGWNEKEDLRAVVNYLRTEGNVSCIGLWGRSMGAVTSLLYGVEDPSIAGMVLDSPFSNLVDLMMELVDSYKYPLPKFTVKLAIQHMHRVIKKKANFDIMDLDTIKAAKNSFVPALFGHATDDDFIQPHHSDQIYKSYTGDKNIIKFDGDHNSPRPQFYFDSITIFFHNVLNPPEVVYDEHFQPDMHGYFDVDNWQAMNMLNCEHNSITAQSSEPITRSNEDAINQVRQRRPMSQTDVPPDVSNQEKLVGLEDDQINTYTQASSSDMINYERYNGSSEYLQYSTDIISDMPSCIEDEERMLMEAIIMSRNNSVATQASEKNDPSSANDCETSSHTFSKLTLDKSSKSSASFTSSENALIVTHKDNLSRGNAQVSLDIVGSTQGETEADTGDEGTSARLVVQKKIKKSSGHILEGLAQKWGNFLRNNEEKY